MMNMSRLIGVREDGVKFRCHVNGRISSVLYSFSALLLIPLLAFTEPVRVGVYEIPPKVFTADDGTTAGLFPEVLQEIAQAERWELEYIHASKDECVHRLKSGDVDLIVDFDRHLKQDLYYSSDTVFIDWDTAYTGPDLSVQSYCDLKGLRVVMSRDDEFDFKNCGVATTLSQLSVSCDVVKVDSPDEVFMLLDDNQADVGIVNNLYGTLHSSEYSVEPTPVVFNPNSVHFMADRQSEKGRRLIEAINRSLRMMKINPDSVYNHALAYYLGGGRDKWKMAGKNYTVNLNLLPEEKAWIRAHPVIRIGIDPDFPPYEFLGANGESSGIATDWLQLISNRTGLQFELVDVTTWSKCVQDMQQKKLDLLPCIGKSSARAEFMLFSEPYLSFSRILVTRNERDIKGLPDLGDGTIALQDNSSHHEFMKEQGFENLQLWPRYEDALLAVSRGEADAAVGNLAVSTHYMRKMMLTNLKMSAYTDTKPNDLYMGVRNDWPELVSIINRAIQSIGVHEQSRIYARWMPLLKPVDPVLDLTQEEREWLLMHPRVSVCWDSHWPPVEFSDSTGKPQGISVDYIHALSEMLGIEFDMLPSAPWQTMYARLLAHEIDMSSCLAPTEQRLEFLDFTESYLTTPTVLFGRNDMAYIRNMDELAGLKVAVVENYATDDWITHEYPEIKPVRLNSVEEGLRRLQNDEIDVFVGNVIVGNYQLSQLGKHDIKIIGETPHSYNLRMAVRNDWPIFTGILRKAMAALPEEDKTSFYRKWVWLKYEHGFDYTLLWKFFLGGLTVLGAVLYWNWRLHREMRSRREAEQALAASREKLEKSYTDLKNLEGLKDDLMHMIIHDMRSPLQGVINSLDLMLLNEDKEVQKQLVENACSSSSVMSTMIEDLLDVSRLENKQMNLRLVSADLMEIAGKAVEVLQSQLVLSKCSVELTGTVSQALMDENVIQRIFVNLIGNAIKASDKNSVITVHISDSETHSMAEVRDEGCGIPVEMQEHVFAKFGRLEDGQSHVVPSIGLGLTFCEMAVEAHGGKIEVESTEGIGSVFRFEIPKK